MRRKLISRILDKKIGAWIDSIEDEKLRKLVSQNVIVSGGAIVSLFQGEKPNDYDVYFRTKEVTQRVAEYYVDQFKKNSKVIFGKDGKEVEIFVQEDRDRVRVYIKSAGIAKEGILTGYQYFEGTEKDEAEQFVSQLREEKEVVVETTEQTLTDLEKKDQKDLIKELKSKKYRPIFLTGNAITLSDKVQLIIRFYGDPDEILKNYDYVHATGYWTSWEKQVRTSVDALESIMNKRLSYQGSLYPVSSVFRIKKFLGRGWTIGAGDMLKISLQISDLNLRDMNVLEDQLIGVDVAYFAELITLLKQAQEKEPDKPISLTYIVSLIDKIFD